MEESGHGAHRRPHGRRRLPRPQRRHPRRRARGRQPRTATRSSASATAGPASSRATRSSSTPQTTRGHPAPRRHDPRHARAPTPTRTARTASTRVRGVARAPRRRRADPDRRRGHARASRAAWRPTASRSSACPKTIDNDLAGTDFTFGFHTAVQIATDAIDRLHTTAESHNRVMVVEVMGRHAGWIAALRRAWPAAPTSILVPERPFDIDEVCERIRRRHASGRDVLDRRRRPRAHADGRHAACRRGAPETDAFGHARLGGIARRARARDRGAHGLRDAHDDPRPRPARRHADRLRPRAGHPLRRARRSTRCTRATFGTMVALRGTEIVARPARRGAAPSPSSSTRALYETAEVFFG